MTKLFIAPNYTQLCESVAQQIDNLIRSQPKAVLGLATGSTPLGVYESLIRRHRQEGLDFSQVTCFNLDEYYGLPMDSPHSYSHFMQNHLFRHIHCRRWQVPEGRVQSREEVAESCRRYEAAIVDAGGLDWQLLGIGRSGHIGFNEPGSAPDSRTRLVTLHPLTREDAAESFGGLPSVPTQAVSMGIGTILSARAITLMARGAGKSEIVRQAWEGEITEQMPASWVRTHPNACLCLDREAGVRLSVD